MPSRSRTRSDARRGFTLLELAAVLAVGSVVMTQLMPMAKRARNNARGMSSAANLMTIGQGAGMYGLDNADRIFSYTWGGPEQGSGTPRYTLPSGEVVVARSDLTGSAAQFAEILQRRTGRIDGEFAILFDDIRIPQRRFIHLIMIDYMNAPLSDSTFIDPSDVNLLNWASSPLDYGAGSSVPYADGVPAGYDDNFAWELESIRQRWAFGSSYQSVPASWQPDGLDQPTYHPIDLTPHLFGNNSIGAGRIEMSDGRRFSEVRFPTAKVYFFEEHDREQAGDPYFGYDQARPEKLMFDGSVNNWASGDASPSWNVEEGKAPWTQAYIPLDRFPLPLGGLGDDTPISQRYRWTLGGLQGVDYATPIRPGNPAALGRGP